MENYIDKKYSYRGKDSKNSIIGNLIRGSLLVKANGLGNRLKKKISDSEIEKLSKKHGVSYDPKDTTDLGASINLETNSLAFSKNSKNKTVLNHELGHKISKDNPKSFNSKRLQEATEYAKKNPFTADYDSYLVDSNKDTIIRSEREAWIEGRKLGGGKEKETFLDKSIRRSALGSYDKQLEVLEQSKAFKEDKDYRNKMLIRTGKKLAGTALGAGAGVYVGKLLSKSDREELSALLKKPTLTEKEFNRKKFLIRKIKAKKIGGGIVGGVGGYYLTKKYLT